AWLFQGNVRHFADDLLGAVKRRALWQLRKAHEVLLVLQRHEPRWHDAEDDEGRSQQKCVNSNRPEFVREDGADAAAVIFRSSLEHAIKAPEESAENFLHPAGQNVLRLTLSFQQQRRESG